MKWKQVTCLDLIASFFLALFVPEIIVRVRVIELVLWLDSVGLRGVHGPLNLVVANLVAFLSGMLNVPRHVVVVLLVLDVLGRRSRLAAHHVRLVLTLRGSVAHYGFAFVIERFVLVDLAQHGEDGHVGDVADEDADVEPREADPGDDAARDDGTEGVGERVGDVGDGVHAAVDGRVAHVNEVGERRQHGRVDERDTEAVDADRDDDSGEAVAEGQQEAADALQTQTRRHDQPVLVWIHLHELHCCVDTDDVRKERREPHHANLPLRGVHFVLHPQSDGRLEEGQGNICHDQSAGTNSDEWVQN